MSHLLLIALLFLLRLGIPLALMLLLALCLRRLDARWEAELRMQQGGSNPASPSPEKRQSAIGEPAMAPTATRSLTAQTVLSTPCWRIKDCPQQQRQGCPAATMPHTLCWLARRQVEGMIPLQCYRCPLFLSLQEDALHLTGR